jgi:hypothetical protein
MRTALWLLLVIAAAVAGYLAGARGGEGPGTRATPREPERTPPGPDLPEPPEPDEAAAHEGPANPSGMRERLVRAVGGGVEEARVQEAAARAVRIRRDHLAAADAAEAMAAMQVAEEIRRERAFLEDKARGGTMELLKNLDTRLTDLVDDEKRFAALFERRTAGPVVNAPTGPRDTLADGATISLPPGVHQLRLPETNRFPRDLLVQGSGMDSTLVRFAELGARDEVHSLTFRDVTIDCQDDYFTDLRSAPAAIRLDRCRVVRFDMGAGGSVMVQADQVAFYATDCRFEAGFGRSPGSGNLFRFQAGLVRLDRCFIQGPFRSIFDTGGAATYLFRRCDIRDAPAREEPLFTAPPDGVRFVDCTFTYLPEGTTTRSKPRPLSDLNPDWPAR